MKKMNWKYAAALVPAAVMAVGLTACGSKEAPKSEPAATTAAAKAETEKAENTGKAEEVKDAYESVTGKVVIYTSMYEDIIEAMDKVLDEKFPNCDIEFFYGGTGTLQSKISAEMEAGKLGCDMLMVAEPSYGMELKDAGILHPYKTPEAQNLAFAYDADGYWYPCRVLNMVLAYNPDLYSPEDIAVTFKDFAEKPELQGYISMSNPLTSGSALASVVGLRDAYGTEYFKALGDQQVAVESGSVALTKLETGECKEVMILEESVLKKREEEGSTLAVIYPEDGVIACPSPVMTVNDEWSANQNTAACEAVTDWILSEEGQSYIMKGWMHSVRKDCTDTPYDSIPNEEMYANVLEVDWDKCWQQRDVVRTEFEENVTIQK